MLFTKILRNTEYIIKEDGDKMVMAEIQKKIKGTGLKLLRTKSNKASNI